MRTKGTYIKKKKRKNAAMVDGRSVYITNNENQLKIQSRFIPISQ